MNDIQKMKRNFRATKPWKNLKNKLKKERKVDELTGKPLRAGWNLHHIDLDDTHYKDISNENNFMCLNKQSHEFLHWFMRYALSDPDIMKRLEEIIEEHKRINKMSLY
jgi:hypothetical protein